MNRWKRLIFYLLLNVLVSTITILVVLFVWENTRLKETLALTSETETYPTAKTTPQDNKAKDSVVEIVDVTGVENLATEQIRIKRVGNSSDQTLSLLNWRIRDENGHEINLSAHLNFQSLDLHSDGAILVHTKAGNSTPLDLYLGLEEPLWSPGETITLLDAEGKVQDTYLIP